MVDHLTVGPDSTSSNAWVLALLLDASQVGWALRVDDTLGSAQGWPSGVTGQAGASLVAIDDLALGIGTARRGLARDLRAHSGRDFVCLLVATNKRVSGIFRRTRANGSVIDNFAQSIGPADADTGVRALLPYAGQLRRAV